MSKTHTAPTTPAQFRKHAERIMRTAHSDVAATMSFDWLRCTRVKWFDGSQGFSGTVQIAAPGYRRRRMVATSSPSGVSVR